MGSLRAVGYIGRARGPSISRAHDCSCVHVSIHRKFYPTENEQHNVNIHITRKGIYSPTLSHQHDKSKH